MLQPITTTLPRSHKFTHHRRLSTVKLSIIIAAVMNANDTVIMIADDKMLLLLFGNIDNKQMLFLFDTQ